MAKDHPGQVLSKGTVKESMSVKKSYGFELYIGLI